MKSLGTWVGTIVCFVAAATDGRELPENGRNEQYLYEEQSRRPEVNYRQVNEASNHSGGAYSLNTIIRPVTYTYFSSNMLPPSAARFEVSHPAVRTQNFHDNYQPLVGQPTSYPEQPRPAVYSPDAAKQPTFLDYGQAQPPYPGADYYENLTAPVANGRSVRFPLNSVLPGNSLSFDHKPYPGLLQAVNTFSDLSPSRNPNEGLLVTHNTVSLPATDDGVTTASRTRITNHGAHTGNYPYREFTEMMHNTQGDRGSILERTQHLRVHQGIDEVPAESFPSYRTGYAKQVLAHSHGHGHGGGGHGGGGGGKHFETGQGERKEEDHHNVKGGKGQKGYKKDHKHHKGAKGHHDKERDSGEFEENSKEEKKYHKDEGFYGEHHKAQKGGKEKKYGEGGKHKKGHTTHGEHNIIKKDEFIKNTKFYDEDHGGGEHEEHGEFYGHHEEKKGGNKEGGHKQTDYSKKNAGKKGHHDKGHVDEEHLGHDSGAGHEDHFEHEEEYGGSKGGHAVKKWGHNSGDKY